MWLTWVMGNKSTQWHRWKGRSLPVKQRKRTLPVSPACQRCPRDPPEPRGAEGSVHSEREGEFNRRWHQEIILLMHLDPLYRPYLVSQIHVGLLGDEQGHDVGPSLLWGQVQGRDALERLGIGWSPVLQQTTGHLHLVLLGGYVQGSVAVLQRNKDKQAQSSGHRLF